MTGGKIVEVMSVAAPADAQRTLAHCQHCHCAALRKQGEHVSTVSPSSPSADQLPDRRCCSDILSTSEQHSLNNSCCPVSVARTGPATHTGAGGLIFNTGAYVVSNCLSGISRSTQASGRVKRRGSSCTWETYQAAPR
jgi:hypothetical protein